MGTREDTGNHREMNGWLEACRSHRDLVVWQKAVDLAVLVYELARVLPTNERDRFTNQLPGAATSVSASLRRTRLRPGSRVQGKEPGLLLRCGTGVGQSPSAERWSGVCESGVTLSRAGRSVVGHVRERHCSTANHVSCWLLAIAPDTTGMLLY